MADTDSVKDVVTSMDRALGHGDYKSRSIKTNLPSDNLGFWLTQGVPTGLIFAHVLLQFIGEIDVGICFVPSKRDNPLDKSQIQYITQFCLNQASDHKCFNANGSLTDECKFSDFCDINSTAPISDTKINFFHSLFVYRNYVWFLFIFAFARGVPQILWGLYFTAEIAVAIEAITIFAELRQPDTELSSHNLKIKKDIERLHKAKAFKKRPLFGLYFGRKILEILLDLIVIILISVFLSRNNTPFHKLVFVCDLYKDRDNIFLCDIIKNRFISCTVSFGFEFIMTLGLQLAVLGFDFLFQAIFLIYLFCPKLETKCTCKVLSCCTSMTLCCCRSVCICSKSKEGEINPTNPPEVGTSGTNPQLGESKETKFNVTSMYSLRDLHLIYMLRKQNKADKDHFLKMVMVEKMIDELEKSNKENTPSSSVNKGCPVQNTGKDDSPRKSDTYRKANSAIN